MNNLPPEILIQIISLACWDGGEMGRSISSVCRTFYQVAKPIKMQCITLTRPMEIFRFAAYVTQPAAEKQVRCLFIGVKTLGNKPKVPSSSGSESSDTLDDDTDEVDSPPAPPTSHEGLIEVADYLGFTGIHMLTGLSSDLQRTLLSILESPNLTLQEANKRLQNMFQVQISCILEAIAPTLQSLTLYTDFELPVILLPCPSPLPALVDLTIHHRQIIPPPNPEATYTGPVLYPNLLHLHVAASRMRPRQHFPTLIGIAPNLTHLHIPPELELFDLSFSPLSHLIVPPFALAQSPNKQPLAALSGSNVVIMMSCAGNEEWTFATRVRVYTVDRKRVRWFRFVRWKSMWAALDDWHARMEGKLDPWPELSLDGEGEESSWDTLSGHSESGGEVLET